MKTNFGFLPQREAYFGTGWTAEPLRDLDSRVAATLSHECCSEKWFYPPIVECRTDPSSQRRPRVPAGRFELPCTHRLEISGPGVSKDDLLLLLYALSFAKGLTLMQDGWGHLARAAVRPGLLSGFYASPRAATEIVDLCVSLSRGHDDGVDEGRRSLTGILCWFLFGQSYARSFEEFSAQYTVLDALCRLYEKTRSVHLRMSHAQRPEELCQRLGMNPPPWIQAKLNSSGRKESDLSRLRNRLIHEGMFGEHPATLGLPEHNLLESIWWLHELNRSLILALIGFNHPSATDPEWKDPIWGEYAGFD